MASITQLSNVHECNPLGSPTLPAFPHVQYMPDGLCIYRQCLCDLAYSHPENHARIGNRRIDGRIKRPRCLVQQLACVAVAPDIQAAFLGYCGFHVGLPKFDGDIARHLCCIVLR